ncbi:TPA: glycosaminoglycan attachment site [Klebsiella pneumoniae]|uniref:glycosaminoglycan attachment site n=2 Tax=Klebsiella pneumoniae TaxID=573 RepID=UPI0019189E9D|nr:glycosaminoglycan attachment site [Klebsiella pneumoniae]MDK5810239.1 glycosaminoglycan attachment site [Klebsiella pneumoniae]MDU6132437.1 glycosaminoglycan attachment site [Klebsiella pneumoniae]MEC5933539.1 glycosaminoglycan attachment site [Klebsiella pneumoniae]UZL67830.1 glycosaminoglycan attachment site [Klebsiella pneumoniae]HBR3034543.1 glycosaminoglycan attachment site [Klebsiella pneumoniae]
MNLFTDVVTLDKQHPIYSMIKGDEYFAERDVLNEWARGFQDRDNKFIKEFQTSFEPCLWELYLHAYMKELGHVSDFSFDAPDFVVVREHEFCIEATIALPAAGQQPAHSFGKDTKLGDFNEFNSQAAVRITNSFMSKVKKLRERYSNLEQCKNKPFIIAIASFDRPFSHFVASRPILAAMYGLYHDEEATMALNAEEVISYNVDSALKNGSTEIDMGLFCTPDFSDVSAVIYSSLATWGKLRALADNPTAATVYQTFTPNPGSIYPNIHTAKKCDYKEHLLDGLYVLHNPFATHPLAPEVLGHARIAQCYMRENGYLDFEAPDDFLLLRYLMSLKYTK